MTATPTKLKNGDWGARVSGSVQEGDELTIRTRAGKTWTATVTRVVWSGNGVSICATESEPRASKRVFRGGFSSSMYCGYPCPVSGRKCCAANGPCHDCL